MRAGLRALAESGGAAITGRRGRRRGSPKVPRVRELRPDVDADGHPDAPAGRPGRDPTRSSTDPGAGGHPRVLVLTTFDEDEHVFEAVRSGAAGYLLKDVAPAELPPHRPRGRGRATALLDPAVTATMLTGRRRRPGAPDGRRSPGRAHGARARGAAAARPRPTNDEIAAEPYLSPATARTYVSRLLAKLGARDRAALVILAYETGLVRALYQARPGATGTSRAPGPQAPRPRQRPRRELGEEALLVVAGAVHHEVVEPAST